MGSGPREGPLDPGTKYHIASYTKLALKYFSQLLFLHALIRTGTLLACTSVQLGTGWSVMVPDGTAWYRMVWALYCLEVEFRTSFLLVWYIMHCTKCYGAAR